MIRWPLVSFQAANTQILGVLYTGTDWYVVIERYETLLTGFSVCWALAELVDHSPKCNVGPGKRFYLFPSFPGYGRIPSTQNCEAVKDYVVVVPLPPLKKISIYFLALCDRKNGSIFANTYRETKKLPRYSIYIMYAIAGKIVSLIYGKGRVLKVTVYSYFYS